MTGFSSCPKSDNFFKGLRGFGGHSLKITDVCMDLRLCFKVHNLVSVRPKSIKLGQMANLNVSFHGMVSIDHFRILTVGLDLA